MYILLPVVAVQRRRQFKRKKKKNKNPLILSLMRFVRSLPHLLFRVWAKRLFGGPDAATRCFD